jgi:hypothetical protein
MWLLDQNLFEDIKTAFNKNDILPAKKPIYERQQVRFTDGVTGAGSSASFEQALTSCWASW